MGPAGVHTTRDAEWPHDSSADNNSKNTRSKIPIRALRRPVKTCPHGYHHGGDNPACLATIFYAPSTASTQATAAASAATNRTPLVAESSTRTGGYFSLNDTSFAERVPVSRWARQSMTTFFTRYLGTDPA